MVGPGRAVSETITAEMAIAVDPIWGALPASGPRAVTDRTQWERVTASLLPDSRPAAMEASVGQFPSAEPTEPQLPVGWELALKEAIAADTTGRLVVAALYEAHGVWRALQDAERVGERLRAADERLAARDGLVLQSVMKALRHAARTAGKGLRQNTAMRNHGQRRLVELRDAGVEVPEEALNLKVLEIYE